MKTTSFILALIISISIGKAQTNHQVSYFSLQDVKLLNSPFLQAQQTDLHYTLALDPDRLSAPFLREAGLTPKAPSYTNWENTGLDGHIGGHYLSALSMMYAATGDTAIYHRLNYMLNELHRAQQAVGTGFIGGTPSSLQLWKEIKAGDIRAGGFSLNGKWVPLYNIHKTYAGLRDAYLYVHSDLARQMLIDLTDWMIDITSGLSDNQMQDMLRSEHGGLNETFADVAEITGDKKYLELARRFSHNWPAARGKSPGCGKRQWREAYEPPAHPAVCSAARAPNPPKIRIRFFPAPVCGRCRNNRSSRSKPVPDD